MDEHQGQLRYPHDLNRTVWEAAQKKVNKYRRMPSGPKRSGVRRPLRTSPPSAYDRVYYRLAFALTGNKHTHTGEGESPGVDIHLKFTECVH